MLRAHLNPFGVHERMLFGTGADIVKKLTSEAKFSILPPESEQGF
jgi:hypothetical protein